MRSLLSAISLIVLLQAAVLLHDCCLDHATSMLSGKKAGSEPVPCPAELLFVLLGIPVHVIGPTHSWLPHVHNVLFPFFSACPPGLQTSVQDWPGRVQLWHVGVPPSGPMDSLNHRLANALVGNPSDAAALEFGLTGPTLKFHCDGLVALTGGYCVCHSVSQWSSDHAPGIDRGTRVHISKAACGGSWFVTGRRVLFLLPL
jgi:hypothetical protein